MRTNDRRSLWERFVLVAGHLAIIAGLALSALWDRIDPAPRKLAPVPAMSILDSFNPDALTK